MTDKKSAYLKRLTQSLKKNLKRRKMAKENNGVGDNTEVSSSIHNNVTALSDIKEQTTTETINDVAVEYGKSDGISRK
jgi:hypothetical protein